MLSKASRCSQLTPEEAGQGYKRSRHYPPLVLEQLTVRHYCCRYTSVSEVLIKPNPKGAASPQVQKDAEAEKVSWMREGDHHRVVTCLAATPLYLGSLGCQQ